MTILSIETSCDESAMSILSGEGTYPAVRFIVHADIVLSQAKLHARYGGVFPAMAKREHAKALVPMLRQTLKEAGMLDENAQSIVQPEKTALIHALLAHEQGLADEFLSKISKIANPPIDAIAVTRGPGLEPALWVGINFAKALSILWNAPVIPINHMEGHLISSLLTKKDDNMYTLAAADFPTLALLISGGHTQLVLASDLLSYRVVGDTKDDAVGEAFDKVARMLGLPYPGGPKIARLADMRRKRVRDTAPKVTLPRPMIHTDTFDFSFAGLKTAVLYTIKKLPALTAEYKEAIAEEFENAAGDVLAHKTANAAAHFGARTLAVGGGVAANAHIRARIADELQKQNLEILTLFPDKALATDNALMIGIAAYLRGMHSSLPPEKILALNANGNLSLAE